MVQCTSNGVRRFELEETSEMTSAGVALLPVPHIVNEAIEHDTAVLVVSGAPDISVHFMAIQLLGGIHKPEQSCVLLKNR
jgi:hypothetical protein